MTRPTNVARARAKLAGMVPAPARAEATAVKYGYARVSTDGRLMLTVLGGLAEFEGELIRARTAEGRARAKANGKSLGRPFNLTDHQRREARKRLQAGDTVREVARSFNVSHSTISRLAA